MMLSDDHVFEQVEALVDYCIENKIIFKLVGDELDIRADRRLLTKGLVSNLKKFKPDIILWLKAKEQQVEQSITVNALTKRDINSEMVLSSNQLRLWLIDQIEPDSAQYNIGITLALNGMLDQTSLTKTFNTILARHEVLRTVYINTNGCPSPLIQPIANYNYTLIDLSSLSAQEQLIQLNSLAELEAQKPFNLIEDLMLRATLIKLTEQTYQLLITLHHIAADVWSIAQLTKELSVLYTAYVENKPNPLPELAIQYADYADWQKKYFTKAKREEHLSYWLKQLQTLPDVHNLPLDNPRPAVQSYRGEAYLQCFDSSLTERLSSFTQQHNVSLFMVLHAGFSCLLSRYSSEQDIVLGTPIANREHPGLSELVGFFANTLVLRAQVTNGITFTELLQQCKSYLLGAYQHQEFPFEQLVDELQPQRNLSYSPLFQVMLILQNGEQKALHLPNLQLHDIAPEKHSAKFDLTLEVVETESGLSLNWQYASDLFNHSTITAMAENFKRLLSGLIISPTQNVFAIDMLSKQQTQHLLIDRNKYSSKAGDEPILFNQVCIQQLFEHQVIKTPDAIAVVLGEKSLTYQSLNKQANQLAAYLLEQQKITPDTFVGILFDRSVDMLISILAVLKSGAAYVPLDPSYPEERLKYILQDTELLTVVSQHKYTEKLANIYSANTRQKAVVLLDDESLISQLSNYSGNNIDVNQLGLTPKNIAYIIYTSGSTGQPKGVVQNHQTISNLVQGLPSSTSVDGQLLPLRTLQYTTINFDVSIQEICTAWFTGSTLVLIDEQQKQDVSSLPVLLDKLVIERLFITPALLTWLTEHLSEQQQQLPALKEIISAGDALILTPALKSFLHNNSKCQLWNHYGPTETHVVTSYHVTASEAIEKIQDDIAVAIGKPIPNIQTYVLSANQCLVPDGVVGELYLGGEGLAQGYLNQKELTEEKFIVNPFYHNLKESHAITSQLLYKTGDLVRWLPDGNLLFLGRIDQQVKIRGFRIELGEIEQVIAQQSSVHDVAVTVQKNDRGDDNLVAYVAIGEQSFLNMQHQSADHLQSKFIERLKDNMQQQVPDYMVPSLIILLPSLPLTANGKIDRKALPKGSLVQSQQIYVAPSTDVEHVLCDIWQKLLKIARIGVTDNFFELGGHSILSIQLVSLVNQAGFNMTTRQLFEYQTIQSLSRILVAESVSDSHENLFVVPLDTSSEYFALSPAQHWFFELNNNSPHQFNIGALHELHFTADIEAMKKALNTVLERHEVLRARFKLISAQWQQFIQPVSTELPFKTYDYSHLDVEQQDIAMQILVKQSQASLNFETGDTLQFSFIDLGNTRPARLLTVFHHLLLDGYALTILLEEFVDLYFTFKQNKKPNLSLASTPYKHAIELLNTHANSIETQAELAYWQYLPTNAVPLPVDCHDMNKEQFNKVNNQGSVLCIGPVSLSGKDTKQLLNTIPAKAKISSIAIVLSAIALAVAKWTNNKQLLIGIGQYGRDVNMSGLDLSRTLGWYAVPFPFFIDFNACINQREVLNLIEAKIAQVPNNGANYSALKYLNNAVEVQQALSQKSCPEIGLNFIAADNASDHSFDEIISTPSDIEVNAYDIAADNNNAYKLDFLIHNIDGKLAVKIKYSANIYHADTMDNLMHSCADELQKIAAIYHENELAVS